MTGQVHERNSCRTDGLRSHVKKDFLLRRGCQMTRSKKLRILTALNDLLWVVFTEERTSGFQLFSVISSSGTVFSSGLFCLVGFLFVGSFQSPSFLLLWRKSAIHLTVEMDSEPHVLTRHSLGSDFSACCLYVWINRLFSNIADTLFSTLKVQSSAAIRDRTIKCFRLGKMDGSQKLASTQE